MSIKRGKQNCLRMAMVAGVFLCALLVALPTLSHARRGKRKGKGKRSRVAHVSSWRRGASKRESRKRTRKRRRRRRVRRKKRRRRLSCRKLLHRSYAMTYIRRGRRLESSLRLYVKHLRRCRLLRRYDRPRVLVYDFRNCKVVALNQHMRTSAASLIKPFVMLAVYHRAYRRGVRHPSRFSSKLQRHINRMMRVSSNSSTNYLIRYYLGRGKARRGLRYINRILPKYGIRRTRLVELIPRSGRTYRNFTTARDLSILMYKIYRKRAVSKAYSKRMLRVMMYSRDNRGRTSYLRANYNVRAATKTGYTRRTNGVAGIVLRGAGLRRHSYNYVAIITRPLVRGANEWRWRKTSSKVLRRISEMTYRHYARGYAERGVRRYGGRRAKRYCRR